MPVRTLEQLADLADQSLLEVTAGETPGFRMLQTVREYALARLAETGEQDTVPASAPGALPGRGARRPRGPGRAWAGRVA